MSLFKAQHLSSPISRVSLFSHLVTPNLVNIVPKSDRSATLRIFKNKIQEEKRYEKSSIESPKLKQDPNKVEIKRSDKGKVVEALADKSKSDYNRTKYQRPQGSMYVNDLWGKKYEILVRKTAQIDVEINNREDLKRKPLQLKLDEAMDYLNQKFMSSTDELPSYTQNTESHHDEQKTPHEHITLNLTKQTSEPENYEIRKDYNHNHRSISLPKINVNALSRKKLANLNFRRR